MNKSYDVYMCRLDKRKETERQLADAELLRSIIDGAAFKISAKAAMAMRTHNRLLSYVAEFAPDYEFAYGIGNCYVAKTPTGKNVVVADVNIMDVGKVYMPREVAEELCRKINNGEAEL